MVENVQFFVTVDTCNETTATVTEDWNRIGGVGVI